MTNCDTVDNNNPDLASIWVDSEASVTEMAQFRLAMQVKVDIACTDSIHQQNVHLLVQLLVTFWNF